MIARALLTFLLVTSSASAQTELAAASPQALCRALRAEEREAGMQRSRCRVERVAQAGGVRAAVLRMSNDRAAWLLVAAQTRAAWRVVRPAAAAYVWQGLSGEVRLRSLTIAQSIAGGPPEIDVLVSRWQTDERECSARPELHHYVCTEQDGAWRCMGMQVEASASAITLEPSCPTPQAPPWSVELSFTATELSVRHVSGTLPPVMVPWIGTHALASVFAEDYLPVPPDTI